MANVYLLEGKKDLGDTASYSGGSLPVNGDSLFITSGSQTIDTNPAALTAVNLARVFISAGFKGESGTAGSPIEFGNVGSLEIDGAGGQHYFKTGTTTALRVAGSGGGKVRFSGGTFTTAAVFRGECEFSGACTVTALKAPGGKTLLRQLTSGAASTSIVVKNGEVVLERSCATLELVRAGAKVTSWYSAAITTKLRLIDGIFTDLSDGTITYLEGVGGVFSTQGAQKVFAITNAELWDGLSINDSNDLSYITWTNQPILYGFRGGGALKV